MTYEIKPEEEHLTQRRNVKKKIAGLGRVKAAQQQVNCTCYPGRQTWPEHRLRGQPQTGSSAGSATWLPV